MSGTRAQPTPADFAPAPTTADRARWANADRAARPVRLARLRARLESVGVDCCLAVSHADVRYLAGMRFDDDEETATGHTGELLVGADEVVALVDGRFLAQAHEEAPDARVEMVGYDLAPHWGRLVASLGARRVGIDPASISHELWGRLASSAPGVELVPVAGIVGADRAVKEPGEVERIAAACANADRALAALLPEIRPGVTETELALRLDILMRSFGADDLAFATVCLGGPRAALPHGRPSTRALRTGEVVLFDFGARVDGYRGDTTRTLFVGEPSAPDLEIYDLVARAQQAGVDAVESAAAGQPVSGRGVDRAARAVIEEGGYGEHFRHTTGHGVGLDIHEAPWASPTASEDPLPTPTTLTVEPGVYLEGRTGVRIEDTLVLDMSAGVARRLTEFPRGVLVIGR